MVRLLLVALIAIVSHSAFSQSDSVFLNRNPKPVIGKVLINHKKAKVNVKGLKDSPVAFSFDEIHRIGLGNGGVYLNESLKSQSQLMLLLVEGKYSLLFSEKEKLFYVRKNDSLLVISQAHFKRALPLIFGKQLTEAYYIKTNSGPEYAAKYLKRLTSYANAESHSQEIVHEQTIEQFKIRLSVGLYAGVGYNRAGFDISTEGPNGENIYKKTGYASGYSIPLGLSLDIALAKRMSIRFDVFNNNVSFHQPNVSGIGTAEIAFPNYIIYPELYDRNLTLSEFSYKSYQLDIAGSYTLFRPERSKIRPYIFAGPTIARLQTAEMGLSSGFRETRESPYRYITGYIELDRPVHMVGFNAGLGAQYDVSKKWTVRLAAKFTGGIYTKISHTRLSSKVKNETTKPNGTWDFRYNVFSHAYDQYLRNFSLTGGLYYRL
ncbi:MAG: hypothetical protein BGO21_13745 [Dyadobacter sp. 50-39]|uniref:hypothetical protein n=1 Tax=Dyadobacter sp. 50-39 TaxID=1895756 RepID=UPI00096229E2|nr:hypothetical protein [Dyadobacter sp. 50-39]OJV17521.1 MAG: hypothetical protein BGO21_13745 [Dyadobacter sp. 50-39]